MPLPIASFKKELPCFTAEVYIIKSVSLGRFWQNFTPFFFKWSVI